MIKTEETHFITSATSHPGIAGKENEDRYRVTSLLTGRKGKTPSVLAVLCDGIGGHRAGEVAAEMGVTIITESIAAGSAHQPLKSMTAAISRASDAIYSASQLDRGRLGMGATCACAWVIGDRLYTANLGDSRIYLLRERHFFQLSTDHTWIQEALDAGIITGEEGGNHPNAHVIRRYLGSKKPPEPDFRLWIFEGEKDEDALKNQGMRIKPGDILMLCSDGLTDLVSDEEIHAVLCNHPIQHAPDILIDMANHRGGHDNITVLLMQNPQKKRTQRKRRWVLGCLIALMVVSAFITALLFGWRWLSVKEEDTQLPPSVTVTLPAATHTAYPSLTSTLTATREAAPQSSITPWHTDTPSP